MSFLLNSVSVTNPEQVLNHPLNNSQTKFQYSFSKSERFQKRRPNCSQAFYNQVSVRDNRSALIGSSKKYDITKSLIVSPSPDTYQIKSKFDIEESSKRGKSFGVSRDNMKQFSYIKPGVLNNPGPSDYQFSTTFRQEGITMRPKTCNLHNPVFLNGKRTYQQNPGPGTYNLKEMMTEQGNQYISNFRSSGATIFNPPTSKRFTPNRINTPGPGAYRSDSEHGLSGHYVLSQFKGEGSRPFSKQTRRSFADVTSLKQSIPGPGNYRIPSEFGNYDHNDAYRTIDDTSSTKRSFLRPSTATR